MRAPIDGTVRRLVLLDKRRGGLATPRNRKAEIAEINIDPGDEARNPFYMFEDGKGYTDDDGQSIYADEADGEDVLLTQDIIDGMQEQVRFIDYIAALIEEPQDKTYILTPQLPYDIEITASGFFVVSGSCDVSFPSGNIAAGQPIVITVSNVNNAFDLAAQINFRRSLTNA